MTYEARPQLFSDLASWPEATASERAAMDAELDALVFSDRGDDLVPLYTPPIRARQRMAGAALLAVSPTWGRA